MIKYNPDKWLTIIFHKYSRKTFKKTLPNMISIAFYVSIFTLVYEFFLKEIYFVQSTVHSLLGIVLGLFLVFRTNTAYDKWWEGRKIWGAMVNDSRNLALKLNAILPAAASGKRKRFAELISNYVVSAKEHLRAGVIPEELSLDEGEKRQLLSWDHRPNYIASKIHQLLHDLYKSGEISGDQLFLVDKEAKAFTDHIGACERIKNTPIPYAYSMYMKKFIFVYSITLPFGFVTTFHFYTIPVVLFIFYFLVTIELIAEEIEDPFGNDDNDLPTDELSEKIGANVHEILVDKVSLPS